jgi:hypothetical protein
MERDAGIGADGATASPMAGMELPADGAAFGAGPEAAVAVPIPESRPIAPARPPGVSETIGGALDLALSGSARIRMASLYIGFVTLLLAGPAIVLFLGLIRSEGFDDTILFVLGEAPRAFFDQPEDAISMLRFATFFALVGVALITLEGQILAATIIGGVATGRPIGIRGALRVSRRVFWSIAVAAFLVGFLENVVSNITVAVAFAMTSAPDASTVIGIVVAGLVIMPFAYHQSGVILGGVGAIEALRRSTRLARARWRLAFLVALAGTVLSFIEIFALGAGLDIVFRVADASGLTLDGPLPVAIATVLVILVVVIAIGSLLVTIAALVAAPQVYAFLKLTGYSSGLDRSLPAADPTGRPLRLITRPMLAVIVLGGLAGLAGILSLGLTPAG